MPYKDPEKAKAYQAKRRKSLEHKKYMQEYRRRNYRRYNHCGYICDTNEYNEMFRKQKGCCAICGTHQTKLTKQLAVDHCHKSGKNRGLLCTTCNTHLGIYEKYKYVFDNYLIKKD